jgi:hypothetical protein
MTRHRKPTDLPETESINGVNIAVYKITNPLLLSTNQQFYGHHHRRSDIILIKYELLATPCFLAQLGRKLMSPDFDCNGWIRHPTR